MIELEEAFGQLMESEEEFDRFWDVLGYLKPKFSEILFNEYRLFLSRKLDREITIDETKYIVNGFFDDCTFSHFFK